MQMLYIKQKKTNILGLFKLLKNAKNPQNINQNYYRSTNEDFNERSCLAFTLVDALILRFRQINRQIHK